MSIEDDYVSFETAKLLEEKGFEGECSRFYMPNGHGRWKYEHYHDFDISDRIECPTLQMTMKWLREKHSQNITVKAHNNVARLKTVYYAEVQNLLEPTENGFCVNGCTFKDTYEEACEAAIKYCLEKLI